MSGKVSCICWEYLFDKLFFWMGLRVFHEHKLFVKHEYSKHFGRRATMSMCCLPLLEIDINIFAKIYIEIDQKRKNDRPWNWQYFEKRFKRLKMWLYKLLKVCCLFRGEPPPAKDRLEYPVPQTDTGRSFFLFVSFFVLRVIILSDRAIIYCFNLPGFHSLLLSSLVAWVKRERVSCDLKRFAEVQSSPSALLSVYWLSSRWNE